MRLVNSLSSPGIDPVSPEAFTRFTHLANRCADLARLGSSEGQYLLVPQVMAMQLGTAPSVEDRLTAGPVPLSSRSGCTIDAAGQVYECRGNNPVACRSEKASSGRVYYPFDWPGQDPFLVWALNALYISFFGPVPANCKVEPLDGDHDNLRLDNLVLLYQPQIQGMGSQQNWRNQ